MEGRRTFARSSIPCAVLLGLALAVPAHAQEPADVAALEALPKAAGELVELSTEPDWGAPDPIAPFPTVPQGAPEVPGVSESEPAAEATEVRYRPVEPQYHAEYHPSQAAPVSEGAPPASAPEEQASEVTRPA